MVEITIDILVEHTAYNVIDSDDLENDCGVITITVVGHSTIKMVVVWIGLVTNNIVEIIGGRIN